jgi:hypothetical protein
MTELKQRLVFLVVLFEQYPCCLGTIGQFLIIGKVYRCILSVVPPKTGVKYYCSCYLLLVHHHLHFVEFSLSLSQRVECLFV